MLPAGEWRCVYPSGLLAVGLYLSRLLGFPAWPGPAMFASCWICPPLPVMVSGALAKQALRIPPGQSAQSSIDLIWHLFLLGSQSRAAGQVASEADSYSHNCLNSHSRLHNSRLLLKGEGTAWFTVVGGKATVASCKPQNSREFKRHCLGTSCFKGSFL